MKTPFIVRYAIVAVIIIAGCNKDAGTGEQIATSSPCMPANLRSGMLAFYPFSHGSLTDESGNGHHLTNNTGARPAPDRNGNPDCAFGFSYSATANDVLVNTQAGFLNNLDQYSISVWYDPLDTAQYGADPFEFMVSRDSNRMYRRYEHTWTLALYDCRKPVFVGNNALWDNDILSVAGNRTCRGERYIRTNVWHHLAITCDKTNNTILLYRDGRLQDRDVYQYAGLPTHPQADNLFLGHAYNGRLDDVILYNRALSAYEVSQLALMGTCCE